MRRSKKIGKARERKPPLNLLFIDTETNNQVDQSGIIDFTFKIGVAIYDKLDKDQVVIERVIDYFNDPEDILNIIQVYLKKRETLYIFGHNIGFDIRVLELPERFNKLGWESEPPILNQRVFIWKVNTGIGKIIFLDSANYGALSVKQMGVDFGIPKLEVDFDNVSNQELFTYCQRDTEIVEKFIIEYIRYIYQAGIAPFQMTLASQSLTAYRNKFLSHEIELHNNPEATLLERKSYYGGRTECFFIGKIEGDEFYYLDVNSMYPFVMHEFPVPTKLLRYQENIPLPWLMNRFEDKYLIADVTLTTERNLFPYRLNNKLVFPVGTFRTQLHHNEIIEAYNQGEINTIHSIATYDKKIIFTDYIEFFYNEKIDAGKRGDKSRRYMAKLFLNSLYGKFGQVGIENQIIGESDKNEVWRIPVFSETLGMPYDEVSWYGKVYRIIRRGESTLSFPAISGAITSYARYVLYRYIQFAGKENVFYCDTDSLIVNKQGFDNLSDYINNNELGYLKLEKQSENITIYGAKDYIFGKEIKTKGVPMNAELIAVGEWKYLQFQGFLSWINHGAINPPKGWFTKKHRVTKYEKGVLLDTGFILPLRIDINTKRD